LLTEYGLWSGPPGPQPAPRPASGTSRTAEIKAGQGAGRGPGGPPHQAPSILTFLLFATLAFAQPPTELWLRGYSVLPTPRNVRLAQGLIELDKGWAIDSKVGAQHSASRSLVKDLEGFHALPLRAGASGPLIRLAIVPGTVTTKSDPEIDRQAYRLRI